MKIGYDFNFKNNLRANLKNSQKETTTAKPHMKFKNYNSNKVFFNDEYSNSNIYKIYKEIKNNYKIKNIDNNSEFKINNSKYIPSFNSYYNIDKNNNTVNILNKSLQNKDSQGRLKLPFIIGSNNEEINNEILLEPEQENNIEFENINSGNESFPLNKELESFKKCLELLEDGEIKIKLLKYYNNILYYFKSENVLLYELDKNILKLNFDIDINEEKILIEKVLDDYSYINKENLEIKNEIFELYNEISENKIINPDDYKYLNSLSLSINDNLKNDTIKENLLDEESLYKFLNNFKDDYWEFLSKINNLINCFNNKDTDIIEIIEEKIKEINNLFELDINSLLKMNTNKQKENPKYLNYIYLQSKLIEK